MAVHTQRERRSGYATYGLLEGQRGGLGFDTSGNPQLVNASGSVIASYGANVKPAVGTELGVSVSTSTTSGVIASLANPFGFDVMVMARSFRVTTPSSGACTVDVGIAANATTSNDGLIDGPSVASAAVITAPGTNGNTSVRWASNQFLNVAVASGDANGLVGTVYVTAIAD